MKLTAVAAKETKPSIVAEETKTRTLRKFDQVNQVRIYREIHRLVRKGKKSADVTLELRRRGERMSDGSDMDQTYVSSAIPNMLHPSWTDRINAWDREDAHLIAPVAPSPNAAPVMQAPAKSPPTARILPQWVLAILTDPALSAEDKVEMVLVMGKPS